MTLTVRLQILTGPSFFFLFYEYVLFSHIFCPANLTAGARTPGVPSTLARFFFAMYVGTTK